MQGLIGKNLRQEEESYSESDFENDESGEEQEVVKKKRTPEDLTDS